MVQIPLEFLRFFFSACKTVGGHSLIGRIPIVTVMVFSGMRAKKNGWYGSPWIPAITFQPMFNPLATKRRLI